MAYKIYDFECSVCKKVQEQFVSDKEGKAEEPCTDCKALPDKLVRLLGTPIHGTHFTWGKWNL